MLAGMFRSGLPAAVHGGGCFIDRDPQWFPTILTFLRDGHVPLPEGALARQQLRAEAQFYSLTGACLGPACLRSSGPACVLIVLRQRRSPPTS